MLVEKEPRRGEIIMTPGETGGYEEVTCPELSLHKVNYYETTKRTKNKRNRISELG
jgi:hypothetical protein